MKKYTVRFGADGWVTIEAKSVEILQNLLTFISDDGVTVARFSIWIGYWEAAQGIGQG